MPNIRGIFEFYHRDFIISDMSMMKYRKKKITYKVALIYMVCMYLIFCKETKINTKMLHTFYI